MTAKRNESDGNRNAGSVALRFLYPLSLFLLAFIPRVLNLQQFVTVDEAKWVYRSAQFLLAFLRGDFAATAVNLTPAVTTTWLGSAGLSAYYLLHRAELGIPFTDWLAMLPQFRVDLPVLAATRWAMAVFSSLSIVFIYLLAKQLWGRNIALIGAVLIALSPHTLALTRIIGHDAPAAFFVTLSLLSLFLSEQANSEWPRSVANEQNACSPIRLFAYSPIFSGAAAGLAFLSKSPTFFLIPFAMLYLSVENYFAKRSWLDLLKQLAMWGGAAYLVFFIFWPAMWVSPVRQLYNVFENAFFSATDFDEAAVATTPLPDEQAPDPGIFYYPINGIFKLSPLVTLGLLLAAASSKFKVQNPKPKTRNPKPETQNQEPETRNQKPETRNILWLVAFVLLFVIFMSFGNKQSSRYILPVFPALAFLAAFGWRRLAFSIYHLAFSIYHLAFSIYHLAFTIVLFGLLTLLPYAPYYFTYYNPLLGGPLTAPRLVKIGWGEGMDQVGRWLEQQPDSASLTVGADYASTLSPYFAGRVVSPTSDNLDYVVAYIKQRQSGSPPPEVIAYYNEVVGVEKEIRLAGIDYASVYPGPAAQPVEGVDGLIAFRPSANFAPIGGAWAVDMIWRDESFAFFWPQVSLQEEEEVLVGQSASFSYKAQDWIVTRYLFSLPESTRPGDYALYADEQTLGVVPARYAQLPADFAPAAANFGGEIELIGYNPEFALSDGSLTLELAFHAAPKAWADYTVYVHLIDEDGNRIVGHDAQPSPPTSQWLKGEVVLDRHALSSSPDLPLDQSYRIRVGLYRADTGEALGESYVLPLEQTAE